MVQKFGIYINELILNLQPDYIVPLETKGAILLEMSLSSIRNKLPTNLKVIYPRAFHYMKTDLLQSSKFLIVDDAVFTCKTICDVYNLLTKIEVPESNINITAFLDFTSGEPGQDYHENIYRRISFPQNIPFSVTRKEALEFIHNQIITERMPSTYDHLLLVSEYVNTWQYENILSYAADDNRLLDYGKRGAFLTSSILLDDLFPGAWDFPPKIRLWYHLDRQILRVAPIASPHIDGDLSNIRSLYESRLSEIKKIFFSGLGSDSEESKRIALYDAIVFTARLQIIPLVKAYLSAGQVIAHIEKTHLNRYFPGISEYLATFAEKYEEPASGIVISSRRIPDNADVEPFGFLSAAKTLLAILKEAYEVQAEAGVPRKDFINKGFTGQEVLDRLQDYTSEQIHAAIDYCFDMNYVSAFLRKSDGLSRAMRTTETQPERHHAEVYAATVIYSQSNPIPAWMIAKVFPIVINTGGGLFDGIIVSKKGPWGDYSEVVMSETTNLYWRDIPSDLWDKTGDDEENNLKFIRKSDKVSEVANISRDPRIAPFRTPIEAALFLMKQFGRKGAVVLNITTGQYGGTEYIAYNLEMILKNALLTNKMAHEHLLQHQNGVREKLTLIQNLYNEGDNIISLLASRCSRLSQLAPITKIEAESIVQKARVFPEKKLYCVIEELFIRVMSIVDACLKDNSAEVLNQLSLLGIKPLEMSNTQVGGARSILLRTHEKLINWVYALGACNHGNKYDKWVFRDVEAESFHYILAYDLTEARKNYAQKLHIKYECIDHILNMLAENWIIALNGRLSKTDINSGDRRYGFFQTFDDCITAASWIVYHVHQLSFVNKLIPSENQFGIAITGGVVEEGDRSNLYGRALDWTGHWLKGKLKEVQDNIADNAGRKDRGFEESPIHLVYHEFFRPELPKELYMVEKPYSSNSDDQSFKIIAFDVKKYIEIYPTPWVHYKKS